MVRDLLGDGSVVKAWDRVGRSWGGSWDLDGI